MTRKTKGKHPNQPIIAVDGVERFKKNAIVCYLLDTHLTADMNSLAVLPFTNEDRTQFAQLIGYSVCGFGELSYVSDKAYKEAVPE